MSPGNLRAVVYIQNAPDEANSLKRLALFFDEIHFILPRTAFVRHEVLKDPKRVRLLPNGKIQLLGPINLLDEVQHFVDHGLGGLNTDLALTLSAFTEH